VDELCNQLGLPVAQVSSALALMELKGLVRALGSMSYAAREPGPDYDL
jgi:predicted Rossmann fold nucleotide-binding protein DprA/Smf involved in DNA uptake